MGHCGRLKDLSEYIATHMIDDIEPERHHLAKAAAGSDQSRQPVTRGAHCEGDPCSTPTQHSNEGLVAPCTCMFAAVCGDAS